MLPILSNNQLPQSVHKSEKIKAPRISVHEIPHDLLAKIFLFLGSDTAKVLSTCPRFTVTLKHIFPATPGGLWQKLFHQSFDDSLLSNHLNRILDSSINIDSHTRKLAWERLYALRFKDPTPFDHLRLAGHAGHINQIAVLQNGNFVIASHDKTATIWSPTGAHIATLSGHQHAIYYVTVLSNGNIVTACPYETMTWLPSGQLIKTHKSPPDGISGIIPSQYDCFITGDASGTLRIWSPRDDRPINRWRAHESSITCISVLPDHKFATGSSDHTVRIWSRRGDHIATLQGHTEKVTCISVLPNGNIVTGSDDRTVRIWSQEGNHIATLTGHTRLINCIFVLPNGNIVTGSNDCTARIWSSTGELITTLRGHTDSVNCISVLSNGNIVTGSDDRTVRVWSQEGDHIATLTENTDQISCIASLKNGKIVTGSFNGQVHILGSSDTSLTRIARGDAVLRRLETEQSTQERVTIHT